MINDILNEADSKMDKSVEATREEFAAIRAGRAHPSMFSKIMVDYYGTPTPIQQLASFTAPEARTILISPFDQGAMKNIERAIRDSDLGVNPADDGKVIRCVFPELTEERRKEYIKVARGKAEDGRVAVRNLRRTAKQNLEKLEKDGEVGKDDVSGAEKRLDGLTKKHTDAIDEMLKNKESELLEV
ncbi:ribosome recycling factor [Nocardioides sp. zg-578]|uniref:Ribosome-recycling factor n=1 Tax=Nocardioides marmotae TaxID=2663857 RepID=A0A6I3JBD4_9ACTN|nr:ribosome recycling factor [Nocardioides marmotae]MCR6031803.1 ribosome recycling factor [Gordonia jinghuaiqii]MTB83373.1 ribosome recycling factor [Nocardioides marmotae]MTB95444.1 ribosome recycling factor [Nocardioides marmotae]QKE00883.1 ribosome recycling factor [Nocardioides marmotae]